MVNMASRVSLAIINGKSMVDPFGDYMLVSLQGASVIDYILIEDSSLPKVLEFKVFVAFQSMLILIVGAVPEYHIDQEEIPTSTEALAKHVRFANNFTSIATEVLFQHMEEAGRIFTYTTLHV
ncbi:UNVERIFIED_CONTAM: hypothetical protein K2H54_022578 [Gekko kuhli]